MHLIIAVTMLLRSQPKEQEKSEDNASDFPFLPDLVLESILTRLTPYDICQLAQTCRELRQRCRRDDIWEPLFNKRWGKFIGPAASAGWRRMLHQNARISALISKPKGGWMRFLICIWCFSRHGYEVQNTEDIDMKPDESFVNLYWYLENGEFWFPLDSDFDESLNTTFGQNHHVRFMLSCYNAELIYGSNLNTTCSRYAPPWGWTIGCHGYAPQCLRSMVTDNGISWIRIRKPPVEISVNELYIPDVAEELRPGDNIEVQWKWSHAFPYEWWYAVIGHADNCKSEDQNCKCHRNEMIWLEFRQYMGSKWGRVQLKRNRTREDGNESDGIYGGIWKSHNKEDICAWLQMWPNESLN